MRIDPLAEGAPDRHRDPYEANQAIPTLLVTRYREQFHEKFSELRVIETRWFSFIVYPCSGGFKSWSLISESFARKMLRLEKKLEDLCGRLFGFRLLIVIEKKAEQQPS